jgi:hypothetical protein
MYLNKFSALGEWIRAATPEISFLTFNLASFDALSLVLCVHY